MYKKIQKSWNAYILSLRYIHAMIIEQDGFMDL